MRTTITAYGFWYALGVLSLFACQSTPVDPGSGGPGTEQVDPAAPHWFKKGKASDYPESIYITGVGFSSPDQARDSAFDQARKLALENIADQIETRIESEKTLITQSLYLDGNYKESDLFESMTRQWTEEVLVGVQYVDEFYDGTSRTAGALGVMDKRTFSERMLQKAREKHTEVLGLLKAFDASREQGRLSEAVKEIIRAHGSMEEIAGYHSKVIAIGTPDRVSAFAGLNDPSLKERITAGFAVVTGIRMEVISGNEQEADLSGKVKEPVVIRITAGQEIPLSGIPVKACIDLGEGPGSPAVLFEGTTSGDGSVTFQLTNLKPSDRRNNTVRVAVDFTALSKHTLMPPPYCSVTYFWRTRSTARVGVVMHETLDGNVQENPRSASVMEEALDDLGFQVIRPNLAQSPADLVELVKHSPKSLADLAKEHCDYLIIGIAECTFSSEVMGQVFFKTRASVDALELESGQVIHFEVPLAKTKAGTIPEKKNQAAHQSLRLAGDALMELLGKKFVDRFDSGSPWGT